MGSLARDSSLRIGDVITVNLTQLSGRVERNFEAVFDMRLAITFRDWCEETGGGIEVDFFEKDSYVEPTKLDYSNPYWLAVKAAIDELYVPLRVVFWGFTIFLVLQWSKIPFPLCVLVPLIPDIFASWEHPPLDSRPS